jgi:hypothetical protein
MLRLLTAGVAAAVIAVTIWRSAAPPPSLRVVSGVTSSCVYATASSAWARAALHLPVSACASSLRPGHRIPAALLAQFPHTAVELNGRVYLDMVLDASPPPSGTP